MKHFLTFAAGLFAYFFLEGFIRLIIMFYHRADFHYYGISHLPDTSWIIVILIAVLINTWLVTMLILSVLGKNPFANSLAFGAILLLWRSVEIINSYAQEPAWYFAVVILLNLTGIFLAYQLFTKQHEVQSLS